jgi:hypothetical protein
MLSRVLLVSGGCVLLWWSLLGLVASLLFDFSTVAGWLTALCVTLPFPLFLIGLISIRAAIVALWLFYLAQWLYRCTLGVPPHLVSPFELGGGTSILVGILCLQLGYVLLRRGQSDKPKDLQVLFAPRVV